RLLQRGRWAYWEGGVGPDGEGVGGTDRARSLYPEGAQRGGQRRLLQPGRQAPRQRVVRRDGEGVERAERGGDWNAQTRGPGLQRLLQSGRQTPRQRGVGGDGERVGPLRRATLPESAGGAPPATRPGGFPRCPLRAAERPCPRT